MKTLNELFAEAKEIGQKYVDQENQKLERDYEKLADEIIRIADQLETTAELIQQANDAWVDKYDEMY